MAGERDEEVVEVAVRVNTEEEVMVAKAVPPRRVRRRVGWAWGGGGGHGEQIVAVDADGGQAVSEAARRDAVRSVLAVGVGGDGVAVVAAEEEHRRLQQGRRAACVGGGGR